MDRILSWLFERTYSAIRQMVNYVNVCMERLIFMQTYCVLHL